MVNGILRLEIIFLIGILSFSALANSRPDLDATYSCEVIESNDRNFPVGGRADSLKLRSLLDTGSIAVKYPTKMALIDFYGSLKIYDVWGVGSSAISFATPPTEPREIHGSISVRAVSESSLELAVLIFHTVRAFDQNGNMEFIFSNAFLPPWQYKLSCLRR